MSDLNRRDFIKLTAAGVATDWGRTRLFTLNNAIISNLQHIFCSK